ncbi:hypothetical protein [Pediococcus acidilactici]|uniref:hypothetical protein n=1 Tax=Pediococcus acidilactici TaxID=1254 RepID=UPI00133069F1|nr:hypothetical protein [Pediococcus acidilactici]KAF0525658.1 hypothetical protein GBP34_05740 [Pediococcus acidilactici]
MKDNSFEFSANMKKVTLDKNGAQVLLTVEDTDFLEVVNQLSNTAGDDVLVKITPNRTELDTDEPQEAEEQKELVD